jgi:hypothetical protein
VGDILVLVLVLVPFLVLVLVLVLLGQWQLILLACSPGCMSITPGSIIHSPFSVLHFPAQVQVPAVLSPGWMHPVRLSICRSSKVFSRRRSQPRALTFLNLNNHSIQITAVVDAATAFVLAAAWPCTNLADSWLWKSLLRRVLATK